MSKGTNVRRMTTDIRRLDTNQQIAEEIRDIDSSFRTDADWNQNFWDRKQSFKLPTKELKSGQMADLAISMIVDEEKDMMTEKIKQLCQENNDIINQNENL